MIVFLYNYVYDFCNKEIVMANKAKEISIWQKPLEKSTFIICFIYLVHILQFAI